jgi:hypothetical protein
VLRNSILKANLVPYAYGLEHQEKRPMATPWTLESELCSLADTAGVGEALCRLGILQRPASEPRIEELHGWRRGGAETFIYRFRVAERDAVHVVMLKAIVAFSTARSLQELGEEWLARRHLLQEEGVRTPRLYYMGRALVVEEFIPEGLWQHLGHRQSRNPHLEDQVVHYAAALQKHGFCPLSPFHGLRTDGNSVFAVDFGQDLGPPGLSASRRGGRLLREAIEWLNSASNRSIDERRAAAVFAFHAADAKSGGMT